MIALGPRPAYMEARTGHPLWIGLDLATEPDETVERVIDTTKMTREERAAHFNPVVFEPSERLNSRLMSELGLNLVTDQALARDIAYFGKDQLGKIMEAYDLTAEELLERAEDERFKELVHKYRVQMDGDVHGMLRSRAAMYLDAQLEHVHSMAIDPTIEARDRLKAVALTAELADAKPRAKDGVTTGSGGVALTFNFGSMHPAMGELKGVLTGEVVANG